jgi:hypothetical protein
MRPTDQLGAAALAYANLGHRVLPLHHPLATDAIQRREMLCSCGDRACGAVGKHPLTAHGLYVATSDPAKLARWWRRWPQANIGLVTGEVADVLDLDGPAGRAALRQAAADHDLRLEGPLVRTGSGWHLYVAPTGTGNRAGLLAHVDWRGRGGYVVAPPSRHASGRGYRWLRPLTAELREVPAPLRSLLDPARVQPSQPVPAAPFRPIPAGHPYGRTALEQELSAVGHAPRGRRNTTLYQAGIRLYSLSPAASSPATRLRPACSPPRKPLDYWSRSQPKPAVLSPPPSEPGSVIPAVSQPLTSQPFGTGPKVEPAGTRSGGSRAGWLTQARRPGAHHPASSPADRTRRRARQPSGRRASQSGHLLPQQA